MARQGNEDPNGGIGSLPQSDRADELEELSVIALQNSLPVTRFRLRSEPGKDRGNDRYLEVKTKGSDTNCRSQIQLKATEAWRVNRDGSVSLGISKSNLNYLLNGSCPLYVYWNATTGELRYCWARDEVDRIAADNPNWHRKKGNVTLRLYRRLDTGAFDDIQQRIVFEARFGRRIHTHAPFANFSKLLQALHQREQSKRSVNVDANIQAADAAAKLALLEVTTAKDTQLQVLTDISPDQIKEIVSLLHGETVGKMRSPQPVKLGTTTVLPPDRARVLGLVAVSPAPFSAANLKTFFPNIDWRNQLRYLARRQLVESRDGAYHVPPRIADTFLKSPDDRGAFLQEWIDVLEPLKWHPDTAFFLGSQQMRAGRLVKSVSTIVDAAESLHPGYWNDSYLSILLTMDDPRVFRKLSEDERVRYLNSTGLCLFRARRYAEAEQWFLRLRKLSKRVRNDWGIGQSYHHCGIVHLDCGQNSKAEYCFRQTVEHTRKTGDRFLLGRALYELAMTVAEKSEDEAEKLLAESEKIKKRSGDDVGLGGVYYGHGVLAVLHSDFRTAIKWFKKAERISSSVGDYHAQALQQYNIGKAYLDLQKHQEALRHLCLAKKMAEDDNLGDVLVLAVGGEAIALSALGKNSLAAKAFTRLFGLHSALGNDDAASAALHDVGAVWFRQKKYDKARKALSDATQHARRKGIDYWTHKCQSDIAQTYFAEGRDSEALSALRRFATREERRGANGIAAKLWLDLLSHRVNRACPSHKVSEIVAKCLRAADRCDDGNDVRIEAYSLLHIWRWQHQEFSASLDALNQMYESARVAGDAEMACRSRDQTGVCLQDLNRLPEAVKAHRAALRAARRLGLPELTGNCLNNLGEALRKSGRYTEAMQHLQEAETAALARSDHEAAISTLHNRALALQHQGSFDDAERLYCRCRDEARKRRFWREYVSALHALANSAWHRGNARVALRRYAKALAAADKRLADRPCELCLNYANALRWSEKPDRALAVLSSASQEFRSAPDAHLYYSELAGLHDDCGDSKSAGRFWQLAFESAELTGNHSALALCAGVLGEIAHDASQVEEADHFFRCALRHENDAGLRATLLLHRLSLLLELGKEKDATSVFADLQTIANKAKANEEYVEALILIGEYRFQNGKNQKEGLRAFVAAMASCTDIDRYVEIGARVAANLIDGEPAGLRKRIDRLRRGVVHWLEKDHGLDATGATGAALLWPFSAASRLAAYVQNGGTIDDDMFSAILAEEGSRHSRAANIAAEE